MMHSDTHAEELEASDPKFKQRNEFNAKARAASRANWVAACDIGRAIMDGTSVPRPTIERVRWPVGNGYLNRDDATFRSLSTEGVPYVRVDRIVAASADAAQSLLDLVDGKGDGVVGLKWLIEHWGVDLDYLKRRNEQHAVELAELRTKATRNPQKRDALIARRVAAMTVDEPAAELLARRIAWATDELAKAATRSGGG